MEAKFYTERKKAIKEIAKLSAAIKANLKSIERMADEFGIQVELELPATGYNGDVWYKPRPPQELEDLRNDPDAEDSPDIGGTDWEWEDSAEADNDGHLYGWKNSSSHC